MTVAEIMSALAAATASASAALLVVLVLRRPMQRLFAVGAAYLAWTLVPLAAIAVLLPVARIPDAVARVLVVPGTASLSILVTQLRNVVPHVWVETVFVLWAVGAAATTLLFVWRQLRFQRELGLLQAQGDGTFVAQVSAGLPAVIGIFRPRIVLPADHAARFDAEQRRLVREHELVHVARGDQLANLLALVLRCLFWFNPLVHWAAPRFRHDQELACDARVIARHPQARRSYGEALLGTQALPASAPLTCQIGFGHPLRERIAMLKRPLPTARRRMAGVASVLALVAGAAYAANVAHTAAAPLDTWAQPKAVPDLRDFYPPEARAQGLEGMVRLRIRVNSDGVVDQAKVSSSDPPGTFDAAALSLAKKMTFKPATRHGKPVDTWLMLPIKFSPHELDNQAADAHN